MDFEVLVPEGYEVVETDQIVNSENVYAFSHFFQATAVRHAAQLNGQLVGPLLRYVAEPMPRAIRKQMGWFHRYVVVPYQNVLRPKEEHIIEVHPDLLKTSCLKHGLFDGEVCPLCEAEVRRIQGR